MAVEKLSMRTIREVLRLKWEKQFSHKQISQSCNIARSTVRDYIARAEQAGLFWSLAQSLAKLFMNAEGYHPFRMKW